MEGRTVCQTTYYVTQTYSLSNVTVHHSIFCTLLGDCWCCCCCLYLFEDEVSFIHTLLAILQICFWFPLKFLLLVGVGVGITLLEIENSHIKNSRIVKKTERRQKSINKKKKMLVSDVVEEEILFRFLVFVFVFFSFFNKYLLST